MAAGHVSENGLQRFLHFFKSTFNNIFGISCASFSIQKRKKYLHLRYHSSRLQNIESQ